MDLLRPLIGRSVETQMVEAPRPGLSLTVLPSVGYNPSYGAFIGASIAIGGWLGEPATTLQSGGSIGASYSTTEQISLQFKSDFYAPNNTWALKGDWRYLDTSQPTFGLGPTEPEQVSYPMDFVLYRLHQTIYRRVFQSSSYVGFGYHFDRYDQIHDTRAELGEPTPFSVYSGGTPSRTQSSALSANILIDTRDNPMNGKRGLFWNASFRSFLKAFGSDDDRQVLLSDFRSYTPLPRATRNVLAIWTYQWFTLGKAPYLDLPAIGWDTACGRSAGASCRVGFAAPTRSTSSSNTACVSRATTCGRCHVRQRDRHDGDQRRALGSLDRAGRRGAPQVQQEDRHEPGRDGDGPDDGAFFLGAGVFRLLEARYCVALARSIQRYPSSLLAALYSGFSDTA
jgi:hypothetical protein